MDPSKEKVCTCGKKYNTLSNLRRHVKNSHKNEDNMKIMKDHCIYKNSENFKHTCKICGKNFNKLYHLRYHERKIHCDNQNEYKIDKESKNCPVCFTYRSSIKLNLIKHFEMEHNITVKTKKIAFSCQKEFDTWKAELEQETLSNFVKIRTKRYSNMRTIDYTCHRSERFVPTGTGKRHLKTKGSCKIGGFCPASINVKIDDGGVYNVDYIETHVGHEHDIGHLHLSKKERSNLAEKISSKIPFDTILDSIRDDVSDKRLERIHLLTRKDLHNIKYTFNLRDSAIRHSNDDSLSKAKEDLMFIFDDLLCKLKTKPDIYLPAIEAFTKKCQSFRTDSDTISSLYSFGETLQEGSTSAGVHASKRPGRTTSAMVIPPVALGRGSASVVNTSRRSKRKALGEQICGTE